MIKHPNCAIYNKRFVDFFERKRRVMSSIQNFEMVPVGGVDVCTSICARRNFETLTAHLKYVPKILTRSGQSDQQVERLARANLSQTLLESTCKRFWFLDYLTVDSLPEETTQLLEGLFGKLLNSEIGSGTSGGYCVTSARSKDKTD